MAGMYPDNQELDIFGEKVQWPGVDSSGKFSNGSFKNPLEKPSFIPAETINLILDNLSELITKLGGTPDNTSTDQLAKLINMASQGDYTDEHPAQGVGLVKTVNRWPNAQECQKNEPWAASPNWVYNLLLGNAAENEVNNVVSQALRARVGVNDLSDKSFQFRGVISKDDLDNTVVQGSYAVTAQGYSGALLVFETHSSTGIVQFYKDGFQNEPWKYRHATDSDTQRWSEWMPFGIKLTTGTPNLLECERNTPWAASPNWVYNLLLGNAAENEVNNVVSQALRARVGVNDLSDKSFQFRGVISKDDLDNTVVQGSYAVTAQGYSGALLVFETHSSTGIVQFYKDGFQNEPWKYRHATDSDTQRWSEWMPFGIDLTTGTQGFFKNIAINIFLKYTCATTENTDEGVLPPPNIEGFRWRFIGLGGGYGPHASVSFWRFELA